MFVFEKKSSKSRGRTVSGVDWGLLSVSKYQVSKFPAHCDEIAFFFLFFFHLTMVTDCAWPQKKRKKKKKLFTVSVIGYTPGQVLIVPTVVLLLNKFFQRCLLSVTITWLKTKKKHKAPLCSWYRATGLVTRR